MLTKYNGGRPLRRGLVEKIEKFFDYRWKNDRRQALDDPEEIALLEQLPPHVQDCLLTKFIYSDFLTNFTHFFKITKKGTLITSHES